MHCDLVSSHGKPKVRHESAVRYRYLQPAFQGNDDADDDDDADGNDGNDGT